MRFPATFRRPLGAFVVVGGLAGCASSIQSSPLAYSVTGNYEAIASCLYRDVEGAHRFGRDVHLTRLSHPQEIRVAVSASSGGTKSSLAWEVELMPQPDSKTRLIVRQASTLVNSQPFWSSYLEPAITRCAASRSEPAQ